MPGGGLEAFDGRGQQIRGGGLLRFRFEHRRFSKAAISEREVIERMLPFQEVLSSDDLRELRDRGFELLVRRASGIDERQRQTEFGVESLRVGCEPRQELPKPRRGIAVLLIVVCPLGGVENKLADIVFCLGLQGWAEGKRKGTDGE